MSFNINTKEELESFITTQWNKVNDHIDQMAKDYPMPIYSSVDIREGIDKFAPVDMNMYPAGFNNLCQLDLDASSKLFKKAINQIANEVKAIGIIPESHTKNLFYLDHLAFLSKALLDTGYEVYLLSFDDQLFGESDELTLISHSKFELKIAKGKIVDGFMQAGDHKIDMALLNHDQSTPINLDWDAIKTPVHPTPKIGWFRRQKSEHFEAYQKVVTQFSKDFSINPNLIMANFKSLKEINFSTKDGLEEIGKAVDSLLSDLPQGTKAFVKASQGTYGMGISVVSSGDEIVSMNRKNRDKMDIGKNKIKFTSVVIQEGVESILKYDDMAAEVAIYLVDGNPAGGFVRANSQKDSSSNLNSRGMVFRKYCISEIRENNDYQSKEAVYSIIARLSTLAGAYEIKNVL